MLSAKCSTNIILTHRLISVGCKYTEIGYLAHKVLTTSKNPCCAFTDEGSLHYLFWGSISIHYNSSSNALHGQVGRLQVRPNFECMQTSLGGYRRKAWLLNLISVLTEPALRFQFPASYSPATPSISSTFSESNKMSHCRSLHLLSSSLSILLLRFALVSHGIHIASWWPLQRYAISPFTPSVRISNHWFSSFLISIRQFPGSWGWQRRSPSPRFLVLSQSPTS